MRVLLSTYRSRWDVEPMVGLAVQSRALGAETRVCARPDEELAELLAGVGVSRLRVGEPVRPLVTRATPPSAADLPRRAASWPPPSSTPSPRRPRNVMRPSRPA
jgi:vancomycin aglycone glucosyltransferase